MKLFINTRNLYPEELRVLDVRLSKEKKELKEIIKYEKFLKNGLIGIICTILIIITKNELLLIALGTIAFVSFGYILFTLVGIYYDSKFLRILINNLNSNINNGKVTVCRIQSKRIAIAKGIVDDFSEGDLNYFIIELDADSVYFYRNTQYIFIDGFPCLDFDIYSDNEAFLMGKPIYPLSEIVNPIIIETNKRYSYEKIFGTPTFNIIKNINFDKLIEQYNNCA